MTTVTSPRRVLAVEWWRGAQTERPRRPGAPARTLQEPRASMDDAETRAPAESHAESVHAHARDGVATGGDAAASDYEVEL